MATLFSAGPALLSRKHYKDDLSGLDVKAIKGLQNQVAATRKGLVSEHRQAGREHGKDVNRLSNRHS